jgi:hypothetical protein
MEIQEVKEGSSIEITMVTNVGMNYIYDSEED